MHLFFHLYFSRLTKPGLFTKSLKSSSLHISSQDKGQWRIKKKLVSIFIPFFFFHFMMMVPDSVFFFFLSFFLFVILWWYFWLLLYFLCLRSFETQRPFGIFFMVVYSFFLLYRNFSGQCLRHRRVHHRKCIRPVEVNGRWHQSWYLFNILLD